MWKVFKSLIQDVKDCYSYIESRGDSYEDCINQEDGTSDFDAGTITATKAMINNTIPFIRNSLITTMDHKLAMCRWEAMISIRDEGIPHGYSSAIEALENFEHSWEESNVIWWQGYLRWYECAVANTQLVLTDQHNLLLKEIEKQKL